MSDDDRVIVDAMTKFGGSFVQKLAELARVADELNLATIKNSFSVYWEQYERMAGTRHERRMMTSYDWRSKWQPLTRGGFEVVDVRPCDEGLQFVVMESGYHETCYCPISGIYRDDGNECAYDLLPVEQPHYDDEKSDPTLVDTVNTIATLTAERDGLREQHVAIDAAKQERGQH